jgi:hypothetical protein
MFAIVVFVAFFLFLFILTLVFPNMPPGQIICNVLGNSETTDSIAGVSGDLLIAAVINGIIWGVVVLIVYSYLRGPPKGKINLPVRIPGYATSRSSKINDKSPKKQADPSFQRFRKERAVESIEGVGYIYGSRLRKLDIITIDDLIQAGSTHTGRENLADLIGVTPSTILEWVREAESRK